MKKDYRILLIDADNTLYDFQQAEYNALKMLFDDMGKSMIESDIEQYRAINHSLWHEFEQGLIQAERINCLRFVRFFEILNIDHDTEVMSQRYLEFLSMQHDLLDGALDVVKILSQKYRLMIVTNGLALVQNKRFQASPIKAFIQQIFISEEMGVQKPHPEMFEQIFEQLANNNKNDYLMIGDSLSSDILGGFQAGIDTCWYNPHRQNNLTQIKPTYEIHALKELIDGLVP